MDRSARRCALLLTLLTSALAPVQALGQSVFGHQIALKVPKGTGGVQPELSLAYQPGAGNGMLGVGWALTGLSAITRVGYGNGIKYAGLDTYAHTTLGILVKQADGSYRTKKESFTRLVPAGTCGDGPCSWTVYDRGGGIFSYGTTADSQLLKQGTTSVRTWSLAKVQDRLGSYYEVAYQLDAANGAAYPSAITYTKNASNPIAKQRTVTFAYEARLDVEPSYAQGALEQLTQRLKWITVASDGALLRKYRLDYEQGISSGRSRLTAVTELGSDGFSAMPSQTFTYQEPAKGMTFALSELPVDLLRKDSAGWKWSTGAQLVDLNGDGRPDVIQGLSDYGATTRLAYLASASGWTYSYQYAPPVDLAGRDASAPGGWDAGVRFFDVNGDGRPDLIRGWYNYGTSYRAAYLNNGGNCSTVGCAWTLTALYAPPADFTGRDASAPGGWNAGLTMADVDGNGRLDLVQAWSNYGTISQAVWLNSGTTWARNTAFNLPAASMILAKRDATKPAGWTEGLQVLDLDGDGRSDLLYGSTDAAGVSTRLAYLNSGSGWVSSASYIPPLALAGYDEDGIFFHLKEDHGIRFVDVNADGRLDLVRSYVYPAYEVRDPETGYIDVYPAVTSNLTYLNTGGGWLSSSAARSPAILVVDGADQGYRFADLNGDGRVDLVKGDEAYLNTGNGWLRDDAFAPYFGLVDGVQTVDLDGRLAIHQSLTVVGTTSTALRATLVPIDSRTPDLLSRVSNGLGGEVSVTYAPATLVPGAIAPLSTGPGATNPTPQPLVTSVTTSNGRGGVYTTRYGYSDARFLPGTIPTQRNLGFAFIDTIDERTGQWTRTTYRQDAPFEGREAEATAFDAAGRVLSKVTHTWGACPATPACATTAIGAGTELVLETVKQVDAYEAGVAAIGQTTRFTYGPYASTTVVSQDAARLPGNTEPLPNVTVTTTYVDDAASWLLGKVTEVKTTSGATTLAWSKNVWTNSTITTKREWLSTTGAWLDTVLGYDAWGNITSVTEPQAADALLRRTITEFDTSFRLYPVRLTNAVGHVTQKTVNADGLVTSITGPNGEVASTEYDVFGRKVLETRPDGGSTSYAYLGYGAASGQFNQSITEVDGQRAITRREWFDGSGNVWQTSLTGDGPKDVWVTTCRDAAGRPSATSLPTTGWSAPPCGAPGVAWTTTTYDAAGRVASVTTPDGKVSTYGYAVDNTSFTDANLKTTRKFFDARRRVKSIVDPANQTTAYGYDPLGRLTSVTLPNGTTTTVAYDSLNRRTSLVDPQLGTTTSTFDAVGNQTSVTAGGKTVVFTYDALNRVLSKQPPLETPVTYSYDEPAYANAMGRLTTVSDDGGLTHFGYTVGGQVAVARKTIDGRQYTQTFVYDLAGRPTQIWYPNGSHADYSYTDGGNLEAVTLDGNPIAAWTGYSATGRPASVTYGNQVVTTYAYDVVNHLTALTTSKGSATLQQLSYDWYTLPNTGGLNLGKITDGRASKIAYDGANTDETQTYAYDDLYRLTQATGVWGVKSFGYDAIGNLQTFGGLTQRTFANNGQQVTSGTGLSGVLYDAAGNMARKVLDGQTWDYAWTAENRLASTRKGGVLTTSMVYDADGQRVKKVYTPATGPTVTTTYLGKLYEKRTYSDASPERHTLNVYAQGALIATVTQQGTVATAFYDANGWRAELAAASLYDGRTLPGAARKLGQYLSAALAHPRTAAWLFMALFAAFAAAVLVATLRPAGKATAFAPRRRPAWRLATSTLALAFSLTACSSGPGGGHGFLDGPVAAIAGDTLNGPAIGTFYYHRNHITSSAVVTDVSGNEVTRLVYLPFGELSRPNSAGTDTVTSKFTGQEFDGESGLYNYGARYYDPALGRFISADSVVPSLTDAQAFHRYAYARNNPIVFTDPTGHNFFSDVWNGITSAVSAVASAVANGLSAIGNAIASAAQAFGKAIAAGVRWLGNVAAAVYNFYLTSWTYAWNSVKATLTNPYALAGLLLAVAISIVTLNPGPLIIWAMSTGASIAATSIAMAAGVRNPLVLAAIGAVAGAAGGGVTSIWRLLGSAAMAAGIQALGLGKVASVVGTTMALANFLMQNSMSGETASAASKDSVTDPGQTPPDATGGGGRSGLSILTQAKSDTTVANLWFEGAKWIGTRVLEYIGTKVVDGALDYFIDSLGRPGGGSGCYGQCYIDVQITT